MIYEVKVPFEDGIHARPASELVKICQKAKNDVVLSKGETVVNPKSILGLISLGATHGDSITFEISDEDAEVVESLKEFFGK